MFNSISNRISETTKIKSVCDKLRRIWKNASLWSIHVNSGDCKTMKSEQRSQRPRSYQQIFSLGWILTNWLLKLTNFCPITSVSFRHFFSLHQNGNSIRIFVVIWYHHNRSASRKNKLNSAGRAFSSSKKCWKKCTTVSSHLFHNDQSTILINKVRVWQEILKY